MVKNTQKLVNIVYERPLRLALKFVVPWRCPYTSRSVHCFTGTPLLSDLVKAQFARPWLSADCHALGRSPSREPTQYCRVIQKTRTLEVLPNLLTAFFGALRAF